MGDAMLHAAFETLTAAEVRRLQGGLWAKQWEHVRANSAFYRAKLGAAARRGLTLDALGDVPFTEKDELRRSQEGNYPFGDYIACAEADVVRLHRTSETTERPMQLAN